MQKTTLPSPSQEILLKLAFSSASEVPEFAEKWANEVDLDFIDGESQKVLPLVYQNIKDLPLNPNLLARLKGIFRFTWSRNQLMFHTVKPLIQTLEEAGIDVMLLKGSVLNLLYYSNFGLRPMSDFDLLIHPDQMKKGLSVLQEKGWNLRFPNYLKTHGDKYFSLFQEITLMLDKGVHCDLHWFVFHEGMRLDPEIDRIFWEKSIKNNAPRNFCIHWHLYL